MSNGAAMLHFDAFRYEQGLKRRNITAEQAEAHAAAFQEAQDASILEMKEALDRKADRSEIESIQVTLVRLENKIDSKATKSDIDAAIFKLEVRVLLYMTALAAFMAKGFGWW